MIERQQLVDLVREQFNLDFEGRHGIGHWDHVAQIGEYLVPNTGADPVVVYLFAYLHDSQRYNEANDPEHGRRAGKYVQKLHNEGLLPELAPKQLERLIEACNSHADWDSHSDDATVQTCWDADRLDLWRVGFRPDKRFMNTDYAKKDDVIDFWEN
jgi:uncharacterized protein